MEVTYGHASDRCRDERLAESASTALSRRTDGPSNRSWPAIRNRRRRSSRGVRTSRSPTRSAQCAAGPAAVDKAIAEAAAQLRDGAIRGFEELSRYSTSDLGYVVQLERTQARVGESDDMVPFTLRATMIFRREGDAWKVAHRHADPITTARPITTIMETSR